MGNDDMIASKDDAAQSDDICSSFLSGRDFDVLPGLHGMAK